jgi:outer membrane protein TolC
MFNIPWPGKLATAGRRALEEARAAGRRFEQAKFDLQKKVLASYHDWALLAETVRIQEANAALLQVVSESAGARVSAGTAGQEESLRARTEEDLARNELEASRARVPALRARLNALLGREAEAPLSPPLSMPPSRELAYSDAEILALAAERHPELQALAREVEGGKEAIHLAELEWIPEFGVSAGTDLGGIAQSVAGMVTFPILRYEAIRAGIEEARARLRRFEARRRQAQYDVRAGAIATLAAFRDAERQSAFFRETIIPRAEQIIESARASYATGRMDWLDFVAAQRTLNDARLLLARLRAEREKLLAEIEALAAVDAERSVPTRDQPRP